MADEPELTTHADPIMSTLNPYETPKAAVADVGTDLEAERVRRSHINHEASIKSVGVLYYLSAAMIAFGAIMLLGSYVDRSGGETVSNGGYVVFMALLCAGMVVTGRGLHTLKRWARVPTGIFSGLGLLGFPVGTLINGYILWLVFSKKGQVVLSEDYKAIVAATPHVRYRTSIVVWVLFAVVVATLVAALIGASNFFQGTDP